VPLSQKPCRNEPRNFCIAPGQASRLRRPRLPGALKLCRHWNDTRFYVARATPESMAFMVDDPHAESETFLRSMPESYGRVFDAQAITEHSQIVKRRGESVVHVEIWRTVPGGLTVVCVVARDQPGLLSWVASALAEHSLSIETAQIYTRQTTKQTWEAVDFFWVRPRVGAPPIDASLLPAIERFLAERLGA
jgi:UTP:GlnB (protein PII) uridylyltransferase